MYLWIIVIATRYLGSENGSQVERRGEGGSMSKCGPTFDWYLPNLPPNLQHAMIVHRIDTRHTNIPSTNIAMSLEPGPLCTLSQSQVASKKGPSYQQLHLPGSSHDGGQTPCASVSPRCPITNDQASSLSNDIHPRCDAPLILTTNAPRLVLCPNART